MSVKQTPTMSRNKTSKRATQFPRDEVVEVSEKANTNGSVAYVFASPQPIPPRRGGGRTSQYPWKDLPITPEGEEGEWFFVPGKTTRQFASSAYVAGKRLGARFSIREVEKDGERGVGVWRVG